MPWDRKAPFTKDGALVNWPGRGEWDWRDADQLLHLALRYRTFTRGRSSAVLIWTDGAGRRWPMFLAELEDAMKAAVHGRVEGSFCVVKRGQNYGLKLVEAA